MAKTVVEALQEQAKREFPDYVKQGHTIGYRVCPLCGHFEWMFMNNKGEGFKVVMELFNGAAGKPCPRCQTVANRAPEVFTWVAAVVNFQKLKG